MVILPSIAMVLHCDLCFRIFLDPLIHLNTVYYTGEHGVFQVAEFTSLLETDFREG